jgi:hypothetical protein
MAFEHRFSKQSTRVLEITLVADVSDNAFHVSAVNIRRDGLAGTAFNVPFTHTDSNPEDVMLGEALPQDVSIIRLTGTIQA